MTAKGKHKVEVALSLNNTLTPEQKRQLIELVKMCEELGATKESLAPLYTAIFITKSVEAEGSGNIEDIFTSHEVTKRCLETQIGQDLAAEAKRKTSRIELE